MAFLNTVSELKPFKSMWKIKVKIIRLWRQYSAQGGATIEMVLSDSNVSLFALYKGIILKFLNPDIFL